MAKGPTLEVKFTGDTRGLSKSTGEATTSLGRFKQSVSSADGAVGKFKAGTASAFGAVKANAGALALGAGAALVAFGAKSVQAFTSGALAAGQFADATGLSVEEASRWVSAADDIGISSEAIEKAMGKMAIQLGKSNAVAEQYGIEVVKNADGTDNLSETMLHAIDVVGKIPNATEKARVAQELWGRGYADVAELVMNGSEDVRASLESTSEAQVFDREEIDKARALRASMDLLNDAVADIQLTIGEALVPTLTDLADAVLVVKSAFDVLPDMPAIFDPLVDSANAVINPVGSVAGLFSDLGDTLGITASESESAAAGLDAAAAKLVASEVSAAGATVAVGMVASSMSDAEEESLAFEKALQEVEDQWKSLLGTLDTRDAIRAAANQFDALETAAVDAYVAGADGAADAEQKQREYSQAIDDTKRKVIEVTDSLGDVPTAVTTSIIANIDEGKFAEAERRIAMLSARRTAIIDIYARGDTPRLQSGARASGGPVAAHSAYKVNENGTETLVMGDKSGWILTAAETKRNEQRALAARAGASPRSSTSTTIIQNFPRGVTPTQVAQANRRYVNTQGPV